jgi:hypothetical protein
LQNLRVEWMEFVLEGIKNRQRSNKQEETIVIRVLACGLSEFL